MNLTNEKSKASTKEWTDWKWQFENRIRSVADLTVLTGLAPDALRELDAVAGKYQLAVTPYYLSLINWADKSDPLLLQCLPDVRELNFSIGGTADPLEEDSHMPVPGLVHRYEDRCLVIATNECATYCRHCNRKRLWGAPKLACDFERMADYVRRSRGIREVIISGGDPLTFADGFLDRLLKSFRAIPHVEVLRIGSRTPVAMPMRITSGLCRILKKHRPLWFNTQFNHSNEITREAAAACEMLLDAGIPVSNQSVLLKGINDDYDQMRRLCRGLQRIGVRPYYLFQCDPVAGTDHFRCDFAKGLEIAQKLWLNVSGLCLPRYVIDAPQEGGKVPVELWLAAHAEKRFPG